MPRQPYVDPAPAQPTKPLLRYPTPNIDDLIIVEDVPIRAEGYESIAYGTPHPLKSTAKLVFQGEAKAGPNHVTVRRVWATTRSGQDAYNLSLQYVDESGTHPIFIRSYIEPRATYVRAADKQPLKTVVSLAITSGGTGYTSEPTLTFSGGGASIQGTAKAEVVNGVIVAVYLTSGGEGYTGAPSVAVTGGGGAGGAVTATIQSTGAILVREESQPAGGELSSLFVQVTRVWKTLPGPQVKTLQLRPDGTMELTARQLVASGTVPSGGDGVLLDRVEGQTANESMRMTTQLVQNDGTTPITSDLGYTLRDTDPRTNALIGITYRVRPYNAAKPGIGESFGLGTVIDYKEKEIPGSTNVVQIITSMELPVPFVEYPEVSVTFPGILRFKSFQWDNSYPGRFLPPYPGDGVTDGTYYLLKPRQKKTQGRVINTFSVGPSNKFTIGYQVYTPGTASKVLPIPTDTVHPPIKIFESISDGFSLTITQVENIPASTPATYDSKQVLMFPLGEERYRGNIYWRRVLQVSELTLPNKFGDVRTGEIFAATSGLDILSQPNPAGDRLELKSTNPGDVGVVTIYGRRDNADGVHFAKEAVTLTGTPSVFTSATELWFGVTQVSLSGTQLGTITVRGEGTSAHGVIASVGAGGILDGHTVTVGRTGFTRTYTFRRPARVTITCPAGSALVTSASPASHVVVILNGVTRYFWFSNGSTTDPAVGGTGFAVAFTGGDSASTVAASLRASMQANLTNFHVAEGGGTVITITGIVLGAVTIAQDAGNDFPISIVSGGTADGPDQVRTGWHTNGSVMTDDQVLDKLGQAITNALEQGTYTGTGTTTHADVTAQYNFLTKLLSFDSRLGRAYGVAWVLSETSPALTVTDAMTDGADGPLIASIPSPSTHAYSDILFENSLLVALGKGWNEESAEPYGGTTKNIPAGVGLITSDPINTLGRKVTLRLIASGKPPMPVSYETSLDGVGGWTPGVTALTNIGQQALYDVVLGEAGINYIRLKVTNTSTNDRAMHAEVFFSVI